MSSNPTEEIKKIRHELGCQAEYSVSRIFAELRIQRQSSGRRYLETVTTATPEVAANNRVNRSGESLEK